MNEVTHRFCEGLVFRTPGHVERLDTSRESVKQDGFPNFVSHFPLGHFWDILKKKKNVLYSRKLIIFIYFSIKIHYHGPCNGNISEF